VVAAENGSRLGGVLSGWKALKHVVLELPGYVLDSCPWSCIMYEAVLSPCVNCVVIEHPGYVLDSSPWNCIMYEDVLTPCVNQ
jgi:hypothetical protein